MNNKLTVKQADFELHSLQASRVLCSDTRDTAQWMGVILAELRQQLGLPWDAPLVELYEATVNLREGAKQ